jgi:hypothetical protein
VTTLVTTSIPSNASRTSTEAPILDDQGASARIYTTGTRFRALRTEWSVEVRVLSGAPWKAPHSGAFFVPWSARREPPLLHPGLNSDLLFDRGFDPRSGAHARVHLGAEIGLTDEGRLLGHLVIGERLISERSSGCSTTAGRSRCCTACSATTGRPRRPGDASPQPKRSRCTGSTHWTRGVKGALDHGLGAD